MTEKFYSHQVNLNQRRRTRKSTNDLMSKGTPKGGLNEVFNAYYKDQVRALYRAVLSDYK